MKKYDKYKPSGVDWLGEVPEHWEIKKVKRLFVEKKKETNVELNCGSISYGKVVYKDDEKIPESTKRSYQVLAKGDFLINPLNLNYDLISLRIALSDIDVVVSSGYIILKNRVKLDKNYYKWLLHIFDIVFMKTLGAGVRQTLSFTHLANCDLVFPPLIEQTTIANFLDDKTAKIDQAIAIKQEQIGLLKERKQIIIQEAVTKGLDKTVKLKDSGVEWIGEIPEHWECTSVKHLLSIPITDGPHTTPILHEEGIPFISAEAIKNDKIDFNKMRGFISLRDHNLFCQKYMPKLYDIYMVKSGATTGNIAMVLDEIEFSIWSPLAVFRADEKILPKFLFFSLQSVYFKKGVELKWSFGTQQNIGMGVLSNLPILFTNLKEQQEIVSYIESQSSKIDALIALKEQEIEKLKEYKVSLIDGVVTGKVRVC